MELTNLAPVPAVLIRGIIDKEMMFGSLVARATFSLQPDGALKLAGEQVWKASPGPWEGPAGKMPGDELFYRGGVDVFVIGTARAPQGRPATLVKVGVEIGDKFRAGLSVYGDRVWEKRGGLQPTPPKPFTEIPLTLARAFGGKDVWDELEVAFPDNPEGRGFYVEAANAIGKPLPNLEDPAKPIAQWTDRPDPVGTAVPPATFGPRVRKTVGFDEKTGVLNRLDAAFFNHAFPAMIAPKTVAPGDRVKVTGVRAEGPLEFRLPKTSLEVRLRFGDRELSVPPAIDQIGIESDLNRVFVTYRHPFRYRLVPLQKRACELVSVN